MATQLIPIGNDTTTLDAINAAVDAARPPGVLADASGAPLPANHPLRLRNPTFAVHRTTTINTTSGIVLRVDVSDLPAVPATPRARAVAEPVTLTTAKPSDQATYAASLASIAATAPAVTKSVTIKVG